VPRLGIGGRDREDDVATAIVVMGRTQHTNDIIPRVQAEVAKLNTDGSLPAGVKIIPYYDRSTLVGVTTHTVLHNLIFGCLLVFFIQWVFLGDLRSAIIVSANIPFALFFAIIILVIQGEDANLLSLGAVDFGIIVDSAVIMMENIYRNFQSNTEHRQTLLQHLSEGYWGSDPTSAHAPGGAGKMWTERLRIIFVSALQVDKAVFFTAAITVTAFVPLFTMQGVEGQIFGPMARTYGYALAGALLSTFTVTPVLSSLLVPEQVKETETFLVRCLRDAYTPALRFALARQKLVVGAAVGFLLSGLNLFAMTAGGLIAGFTVAILAGVVARTTELKEDASLATFYLASLALGVTIVSIKGTNIDLLHVLFGNILAMDDPTLLVIAFNATITLIVLAVIYRPLVIESVDPVFLRTVSRAGAPAHLAFLALVVVNLVNGFQALGTLLAVGLMILPAGIARFWSRDMTGMICIAVVSAIVSGYAGLVLSFQTKVPSGPAIILVAAALYMASVLFGSVSGVIRQMFPGRHLEA